MTYPILYLLADSITGMLEPMTKANNKFIANIAQMINFLLINLLEMSLKNHNIKKLSNSNKGTINTPIK